MPLSESKKAVDNESIEDILLKRNLNPKMFDFVPKLDADISVHANWVLGNIYSHHYPSLRNKKKNRDEIARMYHGILHVIRVAIYILVFANLYRLFKNEAALNLTDEDIKLIQIAALFHDAARLDDGVDYWDEQSGQMLYEYLIKIGVSKEKALMLADAVANKDRYPAANIYQELLQNGDCLDIRRVRKIFDANYLYFYKNIASKNRTAFLIMAKLIIEVYGLIVQQGDYFEHKSSSIQRKEYMSKYVYHKIMHDINSGYRDPLAKLLGKKPSLLRTYPILESLSEGLLDFPNLENLAKEYLTETNPLMEEMNKGNIFFRGINLPTRKASEKEIETPEGKKFVTQSGAGVDVTKALRRIGIKTRSNKPDNRLKHGNPKRSVTMIGWGCSILFPAGYCIFNLTDIQRMEAKNFSTGFGKKINFTADSSLSIEEQQIQKSKIINLQQMGGVISNKVYSHNEIIARLTKFDGTMFTLDSRGEDLYIAHPFVAVLEAIYLRFEYYHQAGEWLPIYEYSSVYNLIMERNFTEEDIIEMWKIICLIYMKNLATNVLGLIKLCDTPVESILKLSLYKQQKDIFLDPLSNYPQALGDKIIKTILKEKKQIMKNSKEAFASPFHQKKIENLIHLSSLDLLFLYHCGLLKKSPIRKKILELLNSSSLLEYIRNFKFSRFDEPRCVIIPDSYYIAIKKGITPQTLIEDYNATEEEKKLYYFFLIADYLKLSKITQEIQENILKNCFSHLISYRKDDIREDYPHDAMLSLYIASLFRVNMNSELFNKVKQYIKLGIDYTQIFGKRFENEIYTKNAGRRCNELSLIYNGLELLSQWSCPVQEEVDLLFESWVSRYSVYRNRKKSFFERYPQFAELDIWPHNTKEKIESSELVYNNETLEYKEFFEISLYFHILTGLLVFLRKNPHLDIERKGEETHYQKLLGCFVEEILIQMPRDENIQGEDIIHFFVNADAKFLDYAGLFLKLLQSIKALYPSHFKIYQQAILAFTQIHYIDQFKEIEEFYKAEPIPILWEEKKSDVELKSPYYDSKEELYDKPKTFVPNLIKYAMVDQTPRKYYFFSEVKPSCVVELLKDTIQQDQAIKEALEKEKYEDFPPILCRII